MSKIRLVVKKLDELTWYNPIVFAVTCLLILTGVAIIASQV